MLHYDFILHKPRNQLSVFLAPMISQTDRPRQRFLCQSIGAILMPDTLVITELTQWIYDDCLEIFYRLKRLLNHLTSPEGDLTGVIAAYRLLQMKYLYLVINKGILSNEKPFARNFAKISRKGLYGPIYETQFS